jgi:hypothetical protein
MLLSWNGIKQPHNFQQTLFFEGPAKKHPLKNQQKKKIKKCDENLKKVHGVLFTPY